MGKLYDESFTKIEEGTIVKGRVMAVHNDGVMVDIGFKSEGIVPIQEFTGDDLSKIKVGDEINVYLEEHEDSEGNLILSKEKADKVKVWDDVEKAYRNNEIVRGKIISRIKGGMTVDIGVKAFLPGSQIDLRPVKDMDRLIGQTFQMRIIKMNSKRGNIVLSRRAVLEENRDTTRKRLVETLDEGRVVEGIVKNITEYGAFVDLGGIDGLLHITDMSWGRVNHPSELFSVGSKINVIVLKYDKGTQRVSLGLKQMAEDPWKVADKKYTPGTKVKGKVVSLTDYGAFIELEHGIEGLIHVSEMSWTHDVKHPSKVVSMGDMVEAVVLSIDKENRRISLGMKQIIPNPWDIVKDKYPVGTKIEGKIKNLTEFGAFIGLEEGIDGLIHVSDLSWTKHIKHPSEVLKKGQKVDTVVLKIDSEKERISLGIKQLMPDPWEKEIPEKYNVGTVVKGKIVKVTDFGVFVELEDGIDALMHTSESDIEPSVKVETAFSVGTEITAKVAKIDKNERKIGLSIKMYKKDMEKTEVDEYLKSQGDIDQSLGAVARKVLNKEGEGQQED
ncbi:MAG: 30S ribosomal protein S1 [Nitrospirae bacterium RBG_19FT_COMBO_42_15]|nr:MAG: 30S ribosomal protein S1 [Nitrospirae bacterium RBG_19FT_COMBO_42_15]